MRSLPPRKAFTLLEPGTVVLVATNDGKQKTCWTMVLDFTPRFAITTGEWNHSLTPSHLPGFAL